MTRAWIVSIEGLACLDDPPALSRTWVVLDKTVAEDLYLKCEAFAAADREYQRKAETAVRELRNLWTEQMAPPDARAAWLTERDRVLSLIDLPKADAEFDGLPYPSKDYHERYVALIREVDVYEGGE